MDTEKIDKVSDIFEDIILNVRDEAIFNAELLDAKHECNIHGIQEKCNEIEDIKDSLEAAENDIDKLVEKLRELQTSEDNNNNGNNNGQQIKFDKCFNPEKIKEFQQKVPKMIEEIRKLTKMELKDFPKKIECMTPAEIKAGELRGAGHGLYIPRKKIIKINPSMDSKAIALNFIHENLHHALPELSEKVIDILTTHIGCSSDVLNGDICDFFSKVE